MNSERITETELQQIRKIPKSPLHHIIVPWFTELWDILLLICIKLPALLKNLTLASFDECMHQIDVGVNA